MSIGAIAGCILIGGFFIYNYFYTSRENRKIESWPKTKGTILTSRFVPGGNRVAPRILVEYEFTVDGKRYQSDYVYTGHREYATKGPEDMNTVEFLKNPEVRYNPLKPENCCLLLYPANWVFIMLLWLGIILSLVGWLGWLFRFLK